MIGGLHIYRVTTVNSITIILSRYEGAYFFEIRSYAEDLNIFHNGDGWRDVLYLTVLKIICMAVINYHHPFHTLLTPYKKQRVCSQSPPFFLEKMGVKLRIRVLEPKKMGVITYLHPYHTYTTPFLANKGVKTFTVWGGCSWGNGGRYVGGTIFGWSLAQNTFLNVTSVEAMFRNTPCVGVRMGKEVRLP